MDRYRDGTDFWSRETPRGSFLVAATALAAVLRFLSLGDHPLWIDEYMTWQMLRPVVEHGFWEQVGDAYQSPLTIAALWPLSRDLCSEWLLRLPSAVAGVLSVPLGGLLAARFGGRRTGEWALLLLALNPFLIWYSQEARGYATLVLLGLASTLVLMRMLQEGPRLGSALLYGALAGLASLANNSALFLVAAHALTVLLTATPRDGRRLALWATAFGLAILIPLYWLLQATGILAVDRLAPGTDTGAALREGSTFTPLALPFTFHAFVYGFSLGPSLTDLHHPDRVQAVLRHAPVLVPALLAVAALVVSGLAGLRRRRAGIALIWIVIPLLAVSLLAMRNVKAFNPRYVAVCMPVVLMLAAHGAASWRVGRWPALLVAVFMVVSLAGYFGADRYGREDLRAPARRIAEQAGPQDAVLVPVVSGLFDFYYDGDGNHQRVFDVSEVLFQYCDFFAE